MKSFTDRQQNRVRIIIKLSCMEGINRALTISSDGCDIAQVFAAREACQMGQELAQAQGGRLSMIRTTGLKTIVALRHGRRPASAAQ